MKTFQDDAHGGSKMKNSIILRWLVCMGLLALPSVLLAQSRSIAEILDHADTLNGKEIQTTGTVSATRDVSKLTNGYAAIAIYNEHGAKLDCLIRRGRVPTAGESIVVSGTFVKEKKVGAIVFNNAVVVSKLSTEAPHGLCKKTLGAYMDKVGAQMGMLPENNCLYRLDDEVPMQKVDNGYMITELEVFGDESSGEGFNLAFLETDIQFAKGQRLIGKMAYHVGEYNYTGLDGFQKKVLSLKLAK